MVDPTNLAPADSPVADRVLVAWAETCVGLEPLIKKHIRAMSSGQVLEVRADDPTARLGIPAWCRLSGNVLIASFEGHDGRLHFFLRRK
jgi:TusA-related sulfurtransferase